MPKTSNNVTMLARINSAIDSFDGSEDQRAAVIRANDGAEKLTGIKTISWKGIDREYSITWELKQGGILHVTTRKIEGGPVRVIHEQRFFS